MTVLGYRRYRHLAPLCHSGLVKPLLRWRCAQCGFSSRELRVAGTFMHYNTTIWPPGFVEVKMRHFIYLFSRATIVASIYKSAAIRISFMAITTYFVLILSAKAAAVACQTADHASIRDSSYRRGRYCRSSIMTAISRKCRPKRDRHGAAHGDGVSVLPSPSTVQFRDFPKSTSSQIARSWRRVLAFGLEARSAIASA